jgi:hypothetical protein
LVLALAETTVPQIAIVTGHSLKAVEAILDGHTSAAMFNSRKRRC